MPTHHIPELDAPGLRRFALTTGSIVAVLFGLLMPWLFGFAYPRWPWALAVVLALWGLVAPATLRSVYIGWMRFGLILNRIVSPVVLGLMFFVVITPVAVLTRLLGRDTLSRRIELEKDSYRVPSRPAGRDNMDKPF